MAKLSRKKGTTSQIFHVVIKDSASTTGAGKTGLAYNTAGLVCKYISAGGTLSASITLEDITTLGTYQAPTSNAHIRFKEVSATDPSKGLYELHVHNDWMNLTGGNLIVMLAGAAGMADCQLEIDLRADVNVTHLGGVEQSLTDLKDFADTGYDPATHKVLGVVTADTCTTNTDMRGTDNAALASALATVAGYIDTEVLAILNIVSDAVYGNSAIAADIAQVKSDTGATLAESLSHPTLAEIEASATLAKEATLTAMKGAGWTTETLVALVTLLNAIKARTDNLPETFKRNTAVDNFMFLMVDATDNKTGKTGLTVNATRSIDGSAFGACANAVVEVAYGLYKINLAAADMNGINFVTLKFSATGANDRIITLRLSA